MIDRISIARTTAALAIALAAPAMAQDSPPSGGDTTQQQELAAPAASAAPAPPPPPESEAPPVPPAPPAPPATPPTPTPPDAPAPPPTPPPAAPEMDAPAPPAAPMAPTTAAPAPPAPPPGPTAGAPAPATPASPTAAIASLPDGAPTLSAQLSGGDEVPGPGDEEGWGTARVRVDAEGGRLCYTLTVSDIAAPSAAHIHRGDDGASGPVAIPFNPPAGDSSEGCVTAEQSALTDLLANPTGYYVNVHNAEFAQGAVRGQLAQVVGE